LRPRLFVIISLIRHFVTPSPLDARGKARKRAQPLGFPLPKGEAPRKRR